MASWMPQWGNYNRFMNIGFSAPIADRYGMWQSPSSVTVANTLTETNILTGAVASGSLTIPANYLKAGTMMKINAYGLISTAAAAPTLQIKAKLGAVTVYDSGAVSTTAQIVTATGFEMNMMIGAQTIGAAGTINAAGTMWFRSLTATSIGPSTVQSGTVNTTVANALTITVTWGTADPANTLTVTDVMVELSA